MSIAQSELRNAAARYGGVLRRSSASLQKTGFLCHSHKDRDMAQGLQQWLREQGLELYIDWQDALMPEKPDGETAARIRRVIRSADVFLFLATANSMQSRWCPWELGYSDGVKRPEQIAVIPTRDSIGGYYGNEYLQLYRRIDELGSTGSLIWYPRGSNTPQTLGSF